MSQAASRALPLEGVPEVAAGGDSSEAELVARARTSADAFAELYRRHYPAIARYVRRRVGDEHVAGDLVAETFLVALEELPRYRERGLPFRAWLYRLATSRVSRWARRLPRRAVRDLEEEELPREEERGDPALREAIRSALLALPARYQDALALFYLEDLSVDEVARTLGVRPGTVKARLARGRERLRRRLDPHVKELLG